MCLPLFLYLLFGRDNLAGGRVVARRTGGDRWVDGYLARRLGQVSEFGKKFDPTVDRLLFIVALVAIIIAEAAPIWFCVAVLVRELLVGATIVIATFFFSAWSVSSSPWLGQAGHVPADVRHPGLHARRAATSRTTTAPRSPRGSSVSPASCSRWATADRPTCPRSAPAWRPAGSSRR